MNYQHVYIPLCASVRSVHVTWARKNRTHWNKCEPDSRDWSNSKALLCVLDWVSIWTTNAHACAINAQYPTRILPLARSLCARSKLIWADMNDRSLSSYLDRCRCHRCASASARCIVLCLWVLNGKRRRNLFVKFSIPLFHLNFLPRTKFSDCMNPIFCTRIALCTTCVSTLLLSASIYFSLILFSTLKNGFYGLHIWIHKICMCLVCCVLFGAFIINKMKIQTRYFTISRSTATWSLCFSLLFWAHFTSCRCWKLLL